MLWKKPPNTIPFQLIGANDMWIAATALAHDMSVVTNNKTEFERVPGLGVITY